MQICHQWENGNSQENRKDIRRGRKNYDEKTMAKENMAKLWRNDKQMNKLQRKFLLVKDANDGLTVRSGKRGRRRINVWRKICIYKLKKRCKICERRKKKGWRNHLTEIQKQQSEWNKLKLDYRQMVFIDCKKCPFGAGKTSFKSDIQILRDLPRRKGGAGGRRCGRRRGFGRLERRRVRKVWDSARMHTKNKATAPNSVRFMQREKNIDKEKRRTKFWTKISICRKTHNQSAETKAATRHKRQKGKQKLD